MICFLNLKISIVGNQLFTTVYSKPTDGHLYLQNSSCHNRRSILGIQKGVALRLIRICSSDDEYDRQSVVYKKYLLDRGHEAGKVTEAFDAVRAKPRNVARTKVIRENQKKVVFATKYNPLGPNINKILTDCIPILQNSAVLKDLFPPGKIMIAHKREKNLKELLLRSDPYAIKPDILDAVAEGYVKCDRGCDSCNNLVDQTSYIVSNATGKKYTIRKKLSCKSKYVIYVSYCAKCRSQGVGSTIAWLPRLRNYKSHIKNKNYTCNIVKHFIDKCNDPTEPCKYLKFILVDKLENVDDLSIGEIDELLLEKEKFWIGTLVTQHQGMNGTHDWNRVKRSDKKID